MKKILVSLLAITMLLTTMSASVIPVSATTTSVATTDIFTEDFEGYTKDVNWLSNVTGNYVTSTNTGVTANDWYVFSAGGTDAAIMPVDASTVDGLEADGVDRGQVLKIDGGSSTTVLSMVRTAENEPELGTLTSGYISYANLIKASNGRKLVYEVEYFTPSDYRSGEAQLMSLHGYNTSNNYTVSTYDAGAGGFYSALSTSYGHYFRNMGVYTSSGKTGTYYARSQQSFDDRGQWHTMKVVADFTKTMDENYWNTTRLYYDGKLLTAKYSVKNPTSSQVITTPYEIGDEVYDFASANSNPTTTRTTPRTLARLEGWAFGAKAASGYLGQSEYYINNLKAYWVDALAMGTPVNTESYKTGTIDIPFNSVIEDSVTKYNTTIGTTTSTYTSTAVTTKTIAEVDDSSLALITIVDASGNLVEGGVKSVALTNGGKTVSVTPDMDVLAGNTTYKIAIDPLFCDEYGQALTSTTTAQPVTTYVEFTTAASEFVADVDKTSISATAGSETAVATVTLSEVATAADIAGAFAVTNTATSAEVTTGWTATLSDDGMTVTLDFTGLSAGEYELTMNAITVNGKTLTNAEDIVIAIELSAPVSKVTLFEEDFESGYTVDEDWLHATNDEGARKYLITDTEDGLYDAKTKGYGTSGSAKGVYNFTVDNHKWDIQVDEFTSGSFTTDDSIKVVNTSSLNLGGNFSGNALYMKAVSDGNYKNIVALRRNFEGLDGISLTKQYLDEEETIANPYYGMKLIYELDYKTLASNAADAYTLSPSYNETKLSPRDTDKNYPTICNAYGALRMGSYRNATLSATNGSAHNWYGTQSVLSANKAGKITIVVDQASEVDSVKVYVNDVLQTMPHNMALSDHPLYGSTVSDWSVVNHQGKEASFGDIMYGLSLVGASSTSKSCEYYIDNLKAYLVESFDVVSATTSAGSQFNIAEDEVEFTFTNPVLSQENALASVVVKDASGNTVEGIDAVALSADKRTMTVTLKDLAGAAKYTVELLPTLRDENGIGISPKYDWYDYVTTLDTVSSVVDGVATYTVGDVTSTTQASCYIQDTDAMKTVVSIVTSKSASVSATATAASIGGNTVSTTLTFSNVAANDLPVWYVVAAYGEYNEMLNCSAASATITAGESGKVVPVSFTVEDDSKVKSVKVYIWDGISTMVPYQDVEEI